MTFPYPVTLGVLLIYILIAIVPPRLPLVARLGIQIGLGLGIYFGFKEAEFMLPNGDNLPMSSLFGGDGGMGSFNKYALGVLGTVIGLLVSVIVAVVRKLTGGKGEE